MSDLYTSLHIGSLAHLGRKTLEDFKAVAPARMSGTNPPLNENFKFLKIMIFNLIFLWKIWKYFSDFFKVHIKGGLNYKIMRIACAYCIACACAVFLKT